MFTIDVSDIEKLEKHILEFKEKALPHATRNAINNGVYKAQQEARSEVKATMIMRNRFTIQSIQYDKAKSLKIENQIAIVGSTQKYMADQEFGETKNKTGKEGVAIPSPYSSGESGLPRKKLPRKPNTLRMIELTKGRKKGVSTRQRNFVAIKMAVKSKKRFVFLQLGKKKGIFRVLGGSMKGKKYQRPRELKKVHDMTYDSVKIPIHKWLYPSVMRIKALMPEIYVKELWKQVKKHNLFENF